MTECWSRLGWLVWYVAVPVGLAAVALSAMGGFVLYREGRLAAFLQGGHVAAPAQRDADVPRVTAAVPPAEVPSAVPVDSYPASDRYPVRGWEIISDSAGFIDAVSVDGRAVPAGETLSATDGSFIELAGWAGQTGLGMRFSQVLLTVCDDVIGAVAVGDERPDVARTVHPNLLRSGWHARLYAGDFPSCKAPVLRAYGRPAIGRTVRPLEGAWPVEVRATGTAGRSTIIHEPDGLRPETAPAVDWRMLRAVPDTLNLRRCGDEACAVVGRVSGSVVGAVVERSENWLLLQSAAGSGWARAGQIVAGAPVPGGS